MRSSKRPFSGSSQREARDTTPAPNRRHSSFPAAVSRQIAGCHTILRLLHYELLLAPFLDVGDIFEGRLRGQVDRDDGYRGHPDHVQGYRPVAARAAEQRDGDERRDAATDYRRQLVADRGPAVADARAEELGEEARLGGVHRAVSDYERQHDGQPDQDPHFGVHEPEVGEREQDAEQSAPHIHRPAADAVREPAEERDGEELEEGGDRDAYEGEALRQPEFLDDVGEHEDGEDVEEHVVADARPHRQEDVLGVRAQHVQNGHRGLGVGLLHLPEGRRLHEAQPNVEPHRYQDDAQEERNPPAPGQELLLRQLLEQGEDHRREHEPGRDAHLRPAPVEPAPARRGVLHRHQHSAAPLSSDAEALYEAQHDQQNGRPDADGVVGRHKTYHGGRDPHDYQRDDQHRLAPDLVAIVAEDEPAYRPGAEADAERGEGEERPHQRIGLREEQLVEDQGRRSAVQEVIVPLQGGAYGTGYRYLPDRGHLPPVFPT